jgi:hypothetical protein
LDPIANNANATNAKIAGNPSATASTTDGIRIDSLLRLLDIVHHCRQDNSTEALIKSERCDCT